MSGRFQAGRNTTGRPPEYDRQAGIRPPEYDNPPEYGRLPEYDESSDSLVLSAL